MLHINLYTMGYKYINHYSWFFSLETMLHTNLYTMGCVKNIVVQGCSTDNLQYNVSYDIIGYLTIYQSLCE